jgi:hypothetical protein
MSRRLKLLAVVPVAVAALSAAFGFTARAADNVLVGDVGLNDDYTLSLVDSTGAKVTHLDPGTYTFQIHDHSAFHDFHLIGPGGVDESTTVPEITNVTWTVTLTDGTYTFQCDPHAAVGMKGTFTVGTPPAAPPAAPKPAAPARLAAHVGPGSSIGVSGTGSLSPGKAVVTVRDSSKSDNFHLIGPGVNKATGVGFRGTVRWTVTLKAGNYTFRSDRRKSLRGSFRVSGTTAAASAGGGYSYP